MVRFRERGNGGKFATCRFTMDISAHSRSLPNLRNVLPNFGQISAFREQFSSHNL